MSLTIEHDNGQNNSIIFLAIVKLYASILCCGPASENRKHIKHCFPITLDLGAEKKSYGTNQHLLIYICHKEVKHFGKLYVDTFLNNIVCE